ncbi:MAG TPA: penicillin-binding protein 2, partial [bacterium]|nr:penicillin-binding protein 2 [bacterium]
MISGQEENLHYLHRKIPFIIVFVMIFVLTVLVRLYYLQVLRGEHYEKLADETFVRIEEVVARRGAITDRFGKVLADTRTYYEIVLIPQYLDDQDKIINSLLQVLPLDRQDILNRLYEARFEPRFQPVVVVDDAPYNWVANLQEQLLPDYDSKDSFSLRGVAVRSLPVRKYLYPELFSHALGYLTEIDKEALKKAKEKYADIYSLKDLVGAAGVEQGYELELKGRDGVFARVVDARGREVTTDADLNILAQRAMVKPQPGQTLKTTLSYDAQMAAYQAFQESGKKGTVVALDPNTGEVLVMFSSPGYDANRITKKVDKEYWKKINLDEDKYLFNRAIQGTYPPASTYKVVALAAGIDSGAIDPDKARFTCHGGLHFGNRFFKCWTSHGTLPTLLGLSKSCDVFFYNVGLAVGVDGLAKYARLFGFGATTGIEIPFEKPGLVPSTEWKLKRYHEKWYESETLSVSIGQSYNLVTPLQNAVAVTKIANGGYKITPH